MQRALMLFNLYGCEAVRCKHKNSLKTQKIHFLPVFELTPDSLSTSTTLNHIGWATSMIFESINPTNPRTNPWNFHKKYLRIGHFEKLCFFVSDVLKYFFQKNTVFASSPWKSVTNYVIEWMVLNFDVFFAFQQIPCYA